MTCCGDVDVDVVAALRVVADAGGAVLLVRGLVWRGRRRRGLIEEIGEQAFVNRC